jgi:crossover junction endodeoxyribonuclease RuvC
VIHSHQPSVAAIEETFVNKNALSSLKLGHARGASMLTAAMANIPLYEYAATLVKKSVVGIGRADKHQVSTMVGIILPAAKMETADSADALAVAICHAHHAPMASFVRQT